uniref:Uncharacterized protein n=1 Tax=uncultured marine Nitrospinaceae bacterium TaxID=482920 RepID=A4GIY6_9BACT|nr:hypothetical protein [uncultured marine Nitrospinaceae bacterium]
MEEESFEKNDFSPWSVLEKIKSIKVSKPSFKKEGKTTSSRDNL